MTKFGISVSIAILILVGAVGFLIFGRSAAPVDNNIEIPIDHTVPTPKPTPIKKEFDKTISMNVGDEVTFMDGLNIELQKINDSRCKPDVQCIWQGELSAVFIISGADAGSSSEFTVGTVMNKSVTLKGYKFTLESATEKSANIIASNTKVVSSGYVSGHVNIGPFCPVERADMPCYIPPEAYSSREVIVYKSDAITIKEKGKIDSAGNYKIALAPGSYFVQIKPAGIGEGEKKPVTIKSSETTTLNFDIDTGIR